MASVLEPPTPQQAAMIKEELGEDPGRLEHNLKLFIEWIECQPYLPKDFDRRILPIFLRRCKHNLELAKKKFQVHFSAKHTIPELFYSNPKSKEMSSVPDFGYVACLPDLTPEGNRMTVLKLKDPDISKFDMKAGLQFVGMMFDIRLYEDPLYASDVFIYDGTNFSTAHCAKFISILLKKILTVARISYPQRVAAMHVVNPPPIAEMVIKTMRPYLHEKIRNRFFMHKSYEGLHQHIPKDVLPKELGGTKGSLEELTKRWYQCLVEHSEWWERQKHIKCTGPAPKILQSCGLEDTLGVAGSFRQLEID